MKRAGNPAVARARRGRAIRAEKAIAGKMMKALNPELAMVAVMVPSPDPLSPRRSGLSGPPTLPRRLAEGLGELCPNVEQL